MKKANDLGNESITALVIKLAIPAMIAQLVNVLYSIVDRMYIGNIPIIGETALAGVGVCAPIVTLLTSFGTLVGLGGSILMSMRLGEKRQKDAEAIMANSFMLLLIFSLSLTVIFLFIKDKLLVLFGASQATFVYADTYLTIYTIGTFFALLALGLNFFITCQGFSTVGMATVIIGAIANIILDYVFICEYNMGVAGGAWATVIAQMLSCIYVTAFLFGKRTSVRISFKGYSFAIMKKIIILGISPFIILATDSVIVIIMNTVLQHFGGSTQGDILISSATIVQSYMMLITGPLIGITTGTQAIISYNYGARRTDRVREAEKKIVIASILFCSIMFVVSRIIPGNFVAIFTSNPKYTDISIWGIKVFTLGIIPMSLQYSLVDGFTALGKTRTALFLSATRKLNYALLLTILPAMYNASAAFYAQPLSDLFGGILSVTMFTLTFERHLKLREEDI